MARNAFSWLILPAWLLISAGLVAGGLYLGYRRPEIAVAVIVLFLVAIWLFWSTWHDVVKH